MAIFSSHFMRSQWLLFLSATYRDEESISPKIFIQLLIKSTENLWLKLKLQGRECKNWILMNDSMIVFLITIWFDRAKNWQMFKRERRSLPTSTADTTTVTEQDDLESLQTGNSLTVTSTSSAFARKSRFLVVRLSEMQLKQIYGNESDLEEVKSVKL